MIYVLMYFLVQTIYLTECFEILTGTYVDFIKFKNYHNYTKFYKLIDIFNGKNTHNFDTYGNITRFS